eukprot:897078_1
MTSTKQDDTTTSNTEEKRKELPESVQRLRAYTGKDIRQEIPLQSTNIQQPLKGPYSRAPPVYVGNMSRKDLAKKNRIQTALLGMGLGTFAIGIYGYTVWKRMQLGINDSELQRLEEEALKLVEMGEIDLE